MTRKPPKRVDTNMVTMRSHRRTLATLAASHQQEVERFQALLAAECDAVRLANVTLTKRTQELQRARFIGMRLLENVAAVRSVTDDENIDLLLGIAIDASNAASEFTMRDGAMTPGPMSFTNAEASRG